MDRNMGLVLVAGMLTTYGVVGMLTGHDGALITAVSVGLATIALYLTGRLQKPTIS